MDRPCGGLVTVTKYGPDPIQVDTANATLRNTIEGLNGYAKDTAHQALAAPARRRIRGITACSLFTALLLMAANIRKIRAWRALTAPGKASIAHRAPGAAPASATTSQTADSPQPHRHH